MKQIVLLGTAPASMYLAPFDNPDWEIWGCSPGTIGVPRIDRFFELHRWEPGADWFPPAYVDFLKNFKGEVVMGGHVADVPNCKPINWQAHLEKYGRYFFTSSLAWMMAEAIDQKPDKIAFFGVDMAARTEYGDQRLGCQYFAMIAAAQGIEVGTPVESDLLRPAPLYGICEWSHNWAKQRARAREMAARLTEANKIIAEKTQERAFLEGAMDDQDWQLHSFIGNVEDLGQQMTSPIVPGVMRQPRKSRTR